MERLAGLLLIGVLFCLISVLQLPAWFARRRALRKYWQRTSTADVWQQTFPDSGVSDLQQFLKLVIDAFEFDPRYTFCFLPEDQVLAIYRACYPMGSLGDQMELESLSIYIHKRYGFDVESIWRDDLTLGEIYRQIIDHTSAQANK